MALPILRDDALVSLSDGFALRVSLPWIRSLPVASVAGLNVWIDGEEVAPLHVRLGDRAVSVDALAAEPSWWFLQDRLVVEGAAEPGSGSRRVGVSLHLRIPYLQAGPDGPLTLPFHVERTLVADAAAAPTVSRDVA